MGVWRGGVEVIRAACVVKVFMWEGERERDGQ